MKTIVLSASAGASARINPEASESYALRAARSGMDRSLPDGDRDAGLTRSANPALDDRKPEETEEVRPPASAPVSADGRRQASKFVNRPVSSTGTSSARAHQPRAQTLLSESLLVKKLFFIEVNSCQSVRLFSTLALVPRVRVACSPAGCTTWDSSLTPNCMAWRPYENLIDGELENTTPGKVSGWDALLSTQSATLAGPLQSEGRLPRGYPRPAHPLHKLPALGSERRTRSGRHAHEGLLRCATR